MNCIPPTLSSFARSAIRAMAVLAAALVMATTVATPASAHSSPVDASGAAAPKAAIVAPGPALAYIDNLLRWLGDQAEPAPAAAPPAAAPVGNAEALRAIDQLLAWLETQIVTPEVAPEPAAPVDPTPPAVPELAATAAPAEDGEVLRAIDQFLRFIDPPAVVVPAGYVDLGHGVYGPEHLLRIRRCESTDNYAAVSKSGTYRGAYQFGQRTWDWRAELNGRLDLVGAEIIAVSPADQDQMAVWNYEQRNPYNEWPVCAHR